MRYFINHNGAQKGPWTLEEVQQKLSSQEISLADYVFDEDSNDWIVLMNYGPFQTIVKDNHAPSKNSPTKDVGLTSDEWFVLRGDSKYGPFKFLDLVKMLQQKQLLEFDFVWTKKMASWARVSEVDDFKPEKIKSVKESSEGAKENVFFRRKHARAEIGASVLLHNNSEVWKGHSAELSSGGAGVIIPSGDLNVGQDLFLHFKAGDGVPPFNAVCKIVSKAEVKKNKEFRYGVKFTSISQSVQVAIKKFTEKKAA